MTAPSLPPLVPQTSMIFGKPNWTSELPENQCLWANARIDSRAEVGVDDIGAEVGMGDLRAAIDAVNANDPRTHDTEPLALAQGRKAEAWVVRLDPDASVALRLAARAHHLRRWELPRSDYPEGRRLPEVAAGPKTAPRARSGHYPRRCRGAGVGVSQGCRNRGQEGAGLRPRSADL